MNFYTKTGLKRVLAIIACVAVVLTAVLFPACSCSNEAVDGFIKNVVTIESSGDDGNLYGSGVVICRDGENIVCLTNYHVVKNNFRILVTPHDGNTVAADLVGYSEYHDIAVLVLTDDHGFEFDDLVAKNMFAAAKEGNAHSVGSKGQSPVAVYDGECTATGRIVPADRVDVPQTAKYVPVQTVTCDISAGMSGCAVIDDRGRLTGIGTYRETDGSAYYAVSSLIARRVLETAMRGQVKKGEVMLLGQLAADGGYGAYLHNERGGAGILVSRSGKDRHALGFSGTFLADGFQVNAVGESCPLPVGALITELGGVGVKTASIGEVFAALYDYRLAEGEEGVTLSVKYTLDGSESTAMLAGDGFALIKK